MAIRVERGEGAAEAHRLRLLQDRDAARRPHAGELVDILVPADRPADLETAGRIRRGYDRVLAPEAEAHAVGEQEHHEVGSGVERLSAEQVAIEAGAGFGVFDIKKQEIGRHRCSLQIVCE